MNNWFRSWHGAPIDNKWLAIAKRAGVVPGVVSAVVWALFDYASQEADRGSVVGFDIEAYAAFSGFEEDQVRAVISALTDKGMIGPDGVWKNWQKRQPKREDSSTERVKAHRERTKGKHDDGEHDETQCNAAKHEETLDKIREDKIREDKIDIGVSTSSAPAGGATAIKPNARGTRLPSDWEPTHDLIEFARNEGLSNAQIEFELACFRDHWESASSPNAVKRSWDAAFRNWIRRAAAGFGNARGPSPSRHRPSDGGRLAAMQRAVARVSYPDPVPE